MKYLLALFVVFLTLQPFELQACAVDDAQPPSHHAAMHEDAGSDSECCSPDTGRPTDACGGATHCAFLSLGFVVIPVSVDSELPVPKNRHHLVDGDSYTGPPPVPPFRPPIS